MMKDDGINWREKAIDATGKLSTYLQTIQISGHLHDAKIREAKLREAKLPNIFDNEKGK